MQNKLSKYLEDLVLTLIIVFVSFVKDVSSL